MQSDWKRPIYFFCLIAVLALSGCKIALYRDLSEEDANQMLSLLLLNRIDAEKKVVKSGAIDLMVGKEKFADAVEILRQHGLPRTKMQTIQDVFPAGGLVSSPFQEQAKIAYLKEQQVQKMLISLNGVIDAQVSIVQNMQQDRREQVAPSAAVYIKYSPEENLLDKEANIRNLVLRAVPNLKPEAISIVMEIAHTRYMKGSPTTISHSSTALPGYTLAILLLSAIGFILAAIHYLKPTWLQSLKRPTWLKSFASSTNKVIK
jgi:type III secretion protein J